MKQKIIQCGIYARFKIKTHKGEIRPFEMTDIITNDQSSSVDKVKESLISQTDIPDVAIFWSAVNMAVVC